jgi:hydroxypyruvate isomerase
MKPLLLLSMQFLILLSIHAEQAFKPKFYAFLNGMPPCSSFDEEAKMLKDMGYDGVSQVFGLNQNLIKRAESYKKQGIHALSIYLNAGSTPIGTEFLKPLAKQGFMIELTVQKISPDIIASIRKTAENMSELNIPLALYPHAGFDLATIPQAMKVVREVNHPNLGIMFNLCHFLKNEKLADLEKTIALCSPHLFSISTSGADVDGKNWPTLIQTLDQGTFPQQRLVKALKKNNFKGPVSLQGYGIKGDKRNNLTKSIQAWKRTLKETP